MKKIFIVFISLVFYSTSVVAVEKFKFKYNFHENLPKKWVTEFNNIMNIVQDVMPINEKIEIKFKKLSFLLLLRNLKIISFSNLFINLILLF